MSTLTMPEWRTRAACATADPDLFFPEPGTPADRIREAKRVCAACPVKQACLEDAMRRGDDDGICGGLTLGEREQLLSSGNATRTRRPGKASARQLAVQHGAYLLMSLVEWHMSLEQVATALGSTPLAVYRAFLMLVPARARRRRAKPPTAIEALLATSKEQLKTLERRGISQEEISVVLDTSQSIISASLAVLRQREDAVRQLSRNGQDGMKRLQDEEMRVRMESGAGLTVDDVVHMAGPAIRRMHGQGVPLRAVALELGLCRETVRKAYQEMTTSQQVVSDLNQNQMGAAA